jgi:hypothetical protein
MEALMETFPIKEHFLSYGEFCIYARMEKLFGNN